METMAHTTGVFEVSIDYTRGSCPANMVTGNRFPFRIWAGDPPAEGPEIQLLPGGDRTAPCPAVLAAMDSSIFRIAMGFPGPLSCLAGRPAATRAGSTLRCSESSFVVFSISPAPGAGGGAGRKFQPFPRKHMGRR